MQALADDPHAEFDWPAGKIHVAPLQQPLEQLVMLQVGGGVTHAPL